MIYQYINDVEHVEDIIELFLEFVSQQPEQQNEKPSFDNGYLAHHEDYKLSVFFRANERLNAYSWNEKAIKTGKVAEQGIRAIGLSGNNLVHPHQKTEFMDRMRANKPEGGRILFDFYRNRVDSETALEELVGFLGRKYDTLSYLFFLKDRSKYLPCKPHFFQQSFEKLGMDTECFNSFTYEHYMMFNDAIAELQDLLSNYMGPVTLLNAHSFAWIIGHYDDAREYIFGGRRTEIPVDDSPKKERIGKAKQRVNQSKFRQNLIDLWNGKCCVTGCKLTEVLNASHIKPWRDCVTNAECIDPYNGLLLVPNIDKLFDAGYISFEDDGKVIFSPVLSEEDAAKMGVTKDTKVTGLMPEHRKYLEYHREKVFVGDN